MRTFSRNPGFTAIAVATLAIGIGANTAMFSVLDGVILRPLPYPAPERLVNLNESVPAIQGMSLSYANYLDWRADSQVFEELAAYSRAILNLTGNGNPERVNVHLVTANFFRTLGARPMLGRDFDATDDGPGAEPVVILSQAFWLEHYGRDAEVLGKNVQLSGRAYRVIGIMSPEFRFYRNGVAQLWAPMGLQADTPAFRDRSNHPGINAIGRLKVGVTLARARADMERIARVLETQYPDTNRNHRVRILPLPEMVTGGARASLMILQAAVGFVLLIACANVANLLLARAGGRAREMAIRAAIGAGSGRIARQLLVESVTLGLLGGVAGLFLAGWLLRLVPLIEPGTLPRMGEIHIDSMVFAFTGLVSMLTGLLFGLSPAIALSRQNLSQAVKEGARAVAGSRSRLSAGLMIAEIAISLLLTAGAGLLLRSFQNLRHGNPGFDPHAVVTASVTLPVLKYTTAGDIVRFYDRTLASLKRLPGVESVGIVSGLPFGGGAMDGGFVIAGQPAANENATSDRIPIDAGYLPTMHIPMERGRNFTDADSMTSEKVAIIDQTLARRFFASDDPVGKQISLDEPPNWITIVGVARDVKQDSLMEEADNIIYLPYAQMPLNSASLVVRFAAPLNAQLSALRQAVWAIDPALPVYSIRTMDELMADSWAVQRFLMSVLCGFAVVALAMASIGIYGVMSYLVAQRKREIGLRVALGADPANVMRLVMRQGLHYFVAGGAVGLAGALLMTRVLSHQLFGVSPHDPDILCGAASMVFVVALAACYVPARRAMRLDPIEALRQE